MTGLLQAGSEVRVFEVGQTVKASPARREILSGKIGQIVRRKYEDTPKATRYWVRFSGEMDYAFWGHELKPVE